MHGKAMSFIMIVGPLQQTKMHMTGSDQGKTNVVVSHAVGMRCPRLMVGKTSVQNIRFRLAYPLRTPLHLPVPAIVVPAPHR